MIFAKSDPVSMAPLHTAFSNYFQLALEEGNQTDQTVVHSHPFHEIIYCRSSGAAIQVDDSKYRLQHGDILLIPPKTPHNWLIRSQNGEPYVGYRLWLDSEVIARLRVDCPDLQIPEKIVCVFIHTAGIILEDTEKLFHQLYQEVHLKNPGWESAAAASFIYLMIQLSRAVIRNPSLDSHKDKSELLEAIVSYVHGHLSEKISLEQVAQKFWVSTSTITHLFNRKMGISFYKYVMTLRLAEAKNMILAGMPMEKIAISIGFGDYSAFYRAFKKEFGISPRQYSQSAAE